MATRKTYDSNVKAAAMAALLEGQSVNSVAKEYSIPKGTASTWKKQARKQLDKGGRPSKQAEIGELLIGYLHTNLETLRVQARFFQNEAWLLDQNAADAAVLHGVLTDKTVRLLEALSGGNAES